MKNIVLSFLFITFLSFTAFSQLELVTSFANDQGGIHGLDGAYALVTSNDGKNVYAVSETDHAISMFAIAEEDSSMHFIGSLRNNIDGALNIANVRNITISPDDQYVYTSSPQNDAVSLFSRDNLTGLLSFVESYKNNTGGLVNFNSPRCVEISPDGKNAYVTSYSDNALFVFSRDAVTGKLSYLEKHVDGTAGINGLDWATTALVSPDNKFVYVTGHDDNAIAIFSRSTSTGHLTFSNAVIDGQSGVEGIKFVEYITITSDGKFVYTVSETNTRLAAFSRNTTTGNLTYVQSFDEGNTVGLDSPNGLCLSEDNKYLFVSDISLYGIQIFSRNSSTGVLSFETNIEDGKDGVQNLDGITNINIDYIHGNLFAVARFDDAISRFSVNTATGGLTYKESIVSGQGGLFGLEYPVYLMDDFENKNIYVASHHGAVAVFNRMSTDSIVFKGSLSNERDGITTLGEVRSLAVSDDNKSLYTIGDYGMADFLRNKTEDTLELKQELFHATPGLEELQGPVEIRCSKDSKNVYVTSGYLDYALLVFRKDFEKDTLILEQQIKTDSIGIDPLWGANLLEISPNDKFVYTCAENKALLTYKRDSITGKLSFVDILIDDVDGLDGLGYVTDLAISDDSKFLYATTFYDELVTIFSINQITGSLSFVESIPAGGIGISDYDYISDINISSDNQFIFLQTNNCYLKICKRNTETGKLVFIKEISGMCQNFFRLSQDNKLLYSLSQSNDRFSVYKLTADAELLELGIDIQAVEGDTVWLHINENFETFEWSTGDTEHTTISVTETGYYTVTVTDINDVTSTDTIYVEFKMNTSDITVVSVTHENITLCSDRNSGSISILATGGIGELAYSIDNGQNYYTKTTEFTGLAAGSYIIKIRDENDTIEDGGEVVIEDMSPKIEILPISGPDEFDLSELVTSYHTYGPANSTYFWEINNGEIQGGQGMRTILVDWIQPGTGTLSVVGTDENGCISDTMKMEILLTGTTGLNEANFGYNIAVYPNPSKGIFNISVDEGDFDNTEISVFNVMGAKVFNKKYSNEGSNIQLDLSMLQDGIYWLKLTNHRTNTAVYKIIKE
ncbi:MAG: beta-propeller fold lactonase family protein [Bacteroidales bacterium]|nr:beta-propeller fold lactonase family protein [Bacteroidales bacterium]